MRILLSRLTVGVHLVDILLSAKRLRKYQASFGKVPRTFPPYRRCTPSGYFFPPVKNTSEGPEKCPALFRP